MNPLKDLATLTLHFFYAHSLEALFLFIIIEEAGIPIQIPGDTLIFLAATEQHTTLLYRVAVVLVSSLAALIGSFVLFTVMHNNGRPILLKYGKYIHVNAERIAKMEAWFQRRGRLALLFGRLIPGLRIPITVVAGFSGISSREYLIIGGIASVIWATIYVVLGSIFALGGWQIILSFLTDLLDFIPRWFVVTSVIIFISSVIATATHRVVLTLRLSHRNPESL